MVDDEKTYVEFLAEMLASHLGWKVVTFGSAEAALDALPQLDAGVIVTDYNMPGIDGFEFIRRATPQLPGVPFIMISGHTLEFPAVEPSRFEALRTILPKPFSWRKLADEILQHSPALGSDRRTGAQSPT